MPVYLIRAGETEHVKIGWADEDVEARRMVLQTAHYQELRVIRVIDGPRLVEGWMHRYFGAHRGLGEWFTFQPEMLTIVPDVDLAPETPEADPILGNVERFIFSSGMTPTAFGHRALNDPTLVHELRRGRECKRATRARILQFIADASESNQGEAAA